MFVGRLVARWWGNVYVYREGRGGSALAATAPLEAQSVVRSRTFKLVCTPVVFASVVYNISNLQIVRVSPDLGYFSVNYCQVCVRFSLLSSVQTGSQFFALQHFGLYFYQVRLRRVLSDLLGYILYILYVVLKCFRMGTFECMSWQH